MKNTFFAVLILLSVPALHAMQNPALPIAAVFPNNPQAQAKAVQLRGYLNGLQTRLQLSQLAEGTLGGGTELGNYTDFLNNWMQGLTDADAHLLKTLVEVEFFNEGFADELITYLRRRLQELAQQNQSLTSKDKSLLKILQEVRTGWLDQGKPRGLVLAQGAPLAEIVQAMDRHDAQIARADRQRREAERAARK